MVIINMQQVLYPHKNLKSKILDILTELLGETRVGSNIFHIGLLASLLACPACLTEMMQRRAYNYEIWKMMTQSVNNLVYY